MAIEFKVPGPPQGKARARTFYNQRAGHMSSVTPEKTVLYENLVKTRYLESMEKQMLPYQTLEGPLTVHISAYYEPPKSTSKKNYAKMIDNTILPTKKPDIDNIAKVVLDALNGIAYKDDTQVVNLNVIKRYSNEAYVQVKIERVE